MVFPNRYAKSSITSSSHNIQMRPKHPNTKRKYSDPTLPPLPISLRTINTQSLRFAIADSNPNPSLIPIPIPIPIPILTSPSRNPSQCIHPSTPFLKHPSILTKSIKKNPSINTHPPTLPFSQTSIYPNQTNQKEPIHPLFPERYVSRESGLDLARAFALRLELELSLESALALTLPEISSPNE